MSIGGIGAFAGGITGGYLKGAESVRQQGVEDRAQTQFSEHRSAIMDVANDLEKNGNKALADQFRVYGGMTVPKVGAAGAGPNAGAGVPSGAPAAPPAVNPPAAPTAAAPPGPYTPNPAAGGIKLPGINTP